MKRTLETLLVSALIVTLASCGNNPNNSAEIGVNSVNVKRDTSEQQKEKDMELIKELHFTRGNGVYHKTIYPYKAMNVIAGVEGDVNWSILYPDKYKEKPNLFVAEGVAKNESGQEVGLALLVNRKTQLFEVKRQNEHENGDIFLGLSLDQLLSCDECIE